MLRLLRITCFATHWRLQRSRSQAFCSASGVGVTGFCPRTRPGVQQAALEDTRCRHQHLLCQVSRVTYDSYVVHCNILAAFYLQSITSSFLLVIRSNEQQPRPTPWDDLSFHCEDARTTPPASVYTLELPGTIMFLRTKNLWRVKAYKSQFCAMCWAVRSTIKTVLKVTLLSFTFTVPYHLYFIADSYGFYAWIWYQDCKIVSGIEARMVTSFVPPAHLLHCTSLHSA